MKKNVWSALTVGLDDDERLIWPQMYLQNRGMYDYIRGVAYLIKDIGHPEASLDWVWADQLHKILKRDDMRVLSKMLIVRLRLPWNKLKYEWMISQEELNQYRKYFTVVDVFLRIREKSRPNKVVLADPLEFEMNRDKYEVIEIRYLVAPKYPPETEERFLGINPNAFSTYMQQ
jgi:hypothetical protein